MQNDEKIYELVNTLSFYEIKDEKLVLAVCDYLLEGNLYVNPLCNPKSCTYEKELEFNIENFNWDIKSPIDPTSCQLFLHAFFPIKHLIDGYKIISDDEYLNLASKLIKSWLEHEPNSNNKFTWYDHSASDRVLVMIYFILTIKKNNIVGYDHLIRRINTSIKEHCDFFYNEDNYLSNNHGTMMNKSLYISALYLNDENSVKYRKKSIDRLKKELKINFSDKMVYLENSITYHLFALSLFVKIENEILNPFGDSLGNYLNQSSIEQSIDFLIQYSKPDLNFPIIGDSNKTSLTQKNFFYPSNTVYPHLEWLLTRGKSGNEPKELFKVYQKEGYAFFRNSWDLTKQNDITHVTFKSGFLLKHHKHADDCSFTLFAKDRDIFVDSGTYTYEKGDFRNFFISALAHNTVVVDNENYPFIWGNNNDTGIISHGEEENYSYVVGKNDMYYGVQITRSLCFLKSGDVVLVDDIQSDDNHEYSQYYHLSSKINVNDIHVKLEDNNILVKISDNDIEVDIFQVGVCNVELIKGHKNKPAPGIVSEEFNHLEETISLKFSKTSEKTRFITLITVNDLDKTHEKEYYNNPTVLKRGSNEELVICSSGRRIKIPLKDYSRKMSQYLRVEQIEKNQYTFTITDTCTEELFAWYVLKNGERVDIIWYDSNPVLNYIFTEPGDYQIKYFIQKGKEKKMYTLPKIITINDKDIHKKFRFRSLNFTKRHLKKI